MHRLTTSLIVLIAMSTPQPVLSEALSTAETFAKLKSLTGVWEGAFANGRVHRVTYRLTAGDTVLVETWSLGPGRESMTMYHLDGDALVATHYCPAGNQPTLELRQDAKTGLVFKFRSATNLTSPAANHQHRFEIQFRDDGRFWRSETYAGDGESATEAVTYRRVEEPPAGATTARMQCGQRECDIKARW